MKRRALAALTIALAACGKAPAPATAVNPARSLRNLTADSTEVLTIAMEAAREISPSAQASKALFGGVYVKGRRARQTSDEVIHANGFASASADKAPAMRCEARSSDGRVVPIACPHAAIAAVPPVLTFAEVVATADSAYVGLSEVTIETKKASCITLRHVARSWSVVSNVPIADAKLCGR
jgi:hypothetical protein